MGDKSYANRHDRIIDAAETFFGKSLTKFSAPGGDGRSSFRLELDGEPIIATLRPNFRRTHLEAHVLTQLAKFSDHQPRCLGVVDDIMFQSDVGEKRLNVEIAKVGVAEREDLAHDAVASIFRIQSAARKTDLQTMMPHLGTNKEWILNLVNSIDFLRALGGGISDKFDRVAACERVAVPGKEFVKWDCRSGNAAMDAAGTLRWFDFEYAGLRHGAEDVAWLVGDEAWPVSPQDMFQIISECFDPECGSDLDDYLEYLAVYLTFHSVQRLKLISKESQKRGWLSKEKIRKYDDAGVHPAFAAQICRVGAYASAKSKITAPLSRNFLAALHGFMHIEEQSERQELRRA